MADRAKSHKAPAHLMKQFVNKAIAQVTIELYSF